MYIHIITPARELMKHSMGEVHMSERDPDLFIGALKLDMINPLTHDGVVSIHLPNVSVHERGDIMKLNHIVDGFRQLGYYVCWCEG